MCILHVCSLINICIKSLINYLFYIVYMYSIRVAISRCFKRNSKYYGELLVILSKKVHIHMCPNLNGYIFVFFLNHPVYCAEPVA